MYSVGQRWISEAETDLGLGLIQDVDFRMVTVYFPVIDDVRTYSKEGAPLTRVRFKVGDVIPLQDGTSITISEIQEQNDIIFYGDEDRFVPETHLSGQIQLNQPTERLFSGQIDNNNLYELRQIALQQLSKLRKRPFYGLLGGRTSLLAHQLYIAEQVTQDAIPRVLLADEVGLGKTIEAGLILHRLMLQQRISRVMIMVPDHLLHQWLVEMIRRFNLRFTIVDRAMVAENKLMAMEGEASNMFSDSQLFLCPLSIATQTEVAAQMLSVDWDMLVVDEAHHLEWDEDGHDDAYGLVDQLSAKTAGLLLLTATPEQLGINGHFARLRLLDPERYPSLEQFLNEQQQYQPVAELASALTGDAALTAEQQNALAALLPDMADSDDRTKQLETLIDRRGPGRALYRNTRHGVSGFPQRLPAINYLPAPPFVDDLPVSVEQGLFPELGINGWENSDPRCDWLMDILSQHKKDKIVLICHSAQTVLDLEKLLWEIHATPAAVFHENMDLVERDRAAAYFADHDQGARILLCSEIGSEGRNFQFAHHLVLFDLPFNCDLLEQRIGRLDRIGQKHDIQIHIPAFENHISGRWAQLLNDGLDSFSRPNPAAQPLLEKHKVAIEQALLSQDDLAPLLDQLSSERDELLQALEDGRDRLLELHSCHPTRARQLAQEMTITHIEDEAELNDFIELFADAFGLDLVDLGGECITIAPGDHMLVPDMPHLPEDGFMATTNRDVALSRDDVQFLSWEHPFIDQALELIVSSPSGNAAVGYIEDHGHKTGDCFIQLQFVAQCAAPKALQVERYLPPNAMHLMMTPKGDLAVNEPESLPGFALPLKKGTARGLVEQKTDEVQPLIHKLEKLGAGQLSKMVARAEAKAEEAFDSRLERLQALSQQNPNIPAQLVDAVKQERDQVLAAIRDSQLILDSVRLVFCG
ncbi:RNA polymerase-associated protein RapA [Bacterioplanoides sp. SCSIO 12839]|uniref:RNA polymerase-associated protein RapA n=1 Tax=Bacterioplanoides sp. SCSIO 12839 TaxID=2829569 RepID=UPI002102AF70|nr:RNA polymerase-associated protein RapA [Bacterioplanoides sp. SCSIO 12839]UTW49989.1 RNA polymerase-associated protein RapA [Bacterioplanoides sp. SCSIO 12839]